MTFCNKKTLYPRRDRFNTPLWETLCNNEDPSIGFRKVFMNSDIGYGIFTTKAFMSNEPLLEYKGKIISREEAEHLHDLYDKNGKGCFIFDVNVNGKKFSIDATECVNMARFINDSPEAFSNCRPKQYVLNGLPHIILISKKNLPCGIELRYNYDFKNPESLSWRYQEIYLKPFTIDEVEQTLYGKPLRKKELLTASSSPLASPLNFTICDENQLEQESPMTSFLNFTICDENHLEQESTIASPSNYTMCDENHVEQESPMTSFLNFTMCDENHSKQESTIASPSNYTMCDENYVEQESVMASSLNFTSCNENRLEQESPLGSLLNFTICNEDHLEQESPMVSPLSVTICNQSNVELESAMVSPLSVTICDQSNVELEVTGC
ncbi:uncharacterized protein LOC105843687 isoform X2 [Hydra vulgaris]|uniref:uncharacterized protein LOC105843687 isoform X2 n=1 Tax=Hydra vulgaris TaxID=6087 RepID=UPI001F5F4078|nr:uncharacterized protein LOC105843687 isoform X2 [Hydra vulgaris]